MWSIGIRSGFITVLGLIAYGLVIQLVGLQQSLWGNLGSVVLALGVYSGHYYYKAANGGCMTYNQGLKLGLIIVSFTGLINALPVYWYTQRIDKSLIVQLQKNIQQAVQQTAIDETIAKKTVQLVQNITPEILSIGVFSSTVLLGLVFTLVITVFSRHSPKTSQL